MTPPVSFEPRVSACFIGRAVARRAWVLLVVSDCRSAFLKNNFNCRTIVNISGEQKKKVINNTHACVALDNKTSCARGLLRSRRTSVKFSAGLSDRSLKPFPIGKLIDKRHAKRFGRQKTVYTFFLWFF